MKQLAGFLKNKITDAGEVNFREHLPVIFLIAVSITARLLFLGSKSLWVDESYATAVAGAGWSELSGLAAASTPHPPFSFALMKISSLLFGYTEFGLRLLPALLGASAVFPVFRFTKRRFGKETAFWAGMLWAFAPWAVSLGQELWVYGTLAALTFWSIDFADVVWHGNKRAIIGFLLFSIAGLYTQHIFVLVIIAGCFLYFTVPRNTRPSLPVPFILGFVLMLIYLPILMGSIDKFAERSERLASNSQFTTDTCYLAFSTFTQLVPGGLLPSDSKPIFHRPGMITWVVLGIGTLLVAVIILSLADKNIPVSFRVWIISVLLLPFLMFIKDAPSARQFSLCWLAVIPAFASVFRKVKWSGTAMTALCVLGLTFYYPLTSFPYHRSDWKGAARIISNEWEVNDGVLVSGGKFGRLVWDFYNEDNHPFYPLNGSNPFSQSYGIENDDESAIIDSLLTKHDRLWIVTDNWAGNTHFPSIEKYQILCIFEAGRDLSISLVGK